MNIYVGNLPYSTTPDDLQAVFSAYGEVAVSYHRLFPRITADDSEGTIQQAGQQLCGIRTAPSCGGDIAVFKQSSSKFTRQIFSKQSENLFIS